jgi:hypothetical protein
MPRRERAGSVCVSLFTARVASAAISAGGSPRPARRCTSSRREPTCRPYDRAVGQARLHLRAGRHDRSSASADRGDPHRRFFEIFAGFGSGETAGTRAMFILGGLVSVAFGVVLFARPGIGAVTLALLFGLFSLFYGSRRSCSEPSCGAQARPSSQSWETRPDPVRAGVPRVRLCQTPTWRLPGPSPWPGGRIRLTIAGQSADGGNAMTTLKPPVRAGIPAAICVPGDAPPWLRLRDVPRWQ